jgi:death-on-curing protein
VTPEPYFLTLEEVVEIHAQALADHGGQDGVRDPGALESALAQPAATMFGALLHEDVFAMAAAYAFHLAENQPFVDGNKRTAIVAALTFLRLNGRAADYPWTRLYDAMMALARGELDKAGLADLLRCLSKG